MRITLQSRFAANNSLLMRSNAAWQVKTVKTQKSN
jgi:hypothetical protein